MFELAFCSFRKNNHCIDLLRFLFEEDERERDRNLIFVCKERPTQLECDMFVQLKKRTISLTTKLRYAVHETNRPVYHKQAFTHHKESRNFFLRKILIQIVRLLFKKQEAWAGT
jgi:hypothetical protein